MSNEKQSKNNLKQSFKKKLSSIFHTSRPPISPLTYQPLGTTTTKRTLYIKGYKLDGDKILRMFPREAHEPEETYEFSWYEPIIDKIPESSYKYVGCGLEADGSYNLVLVVEDGYDLSKLEIGVNEPKCPETLPQEALKLLTFGIWPSCDQDP